MLSRVSALLLLFSVFVIPPQVWSEDWTYRLHEGESLSLVAQRFLKMEFTPEQLQLYNGIENDRQIPVGTEIRVPIDWLKDLLAGVKVNYVFGEATLRRRAATESAQLVTETILNAGDRVTTGPDSAVSLLFADNSVLLIGENSEVVFDALSSYKGIGMLDTRIRLQRGRVENRITPLKRPESRYEIHTPAAVTVVRGTDFRISADAADALTRSEVTEGDVEVSAQGESVRVNRGEGTLVEQGKPPAEPRKLLPEPDLSGLTIETAGDALQLGWPELEGAVSYRYQLKDSGKVMVGGGISRSNKAILPMLPAGEYELGLRGIDDWGLEGLEAIHIFQLETVAAPSPVRKTEPTLSAAQLQPPVFSPRGMALRWTSVSGAWAYRFILARDPALEDILFERLAYDQGFLIRPPGPGRYFIAIEALFNDMDKTTLSNIYRIEIPRWR